MTFSDDVSLIARVVAGDQDALRALYADYRPRLRRYLWHQLDGDAAAVDDALQEIFLAVWRSAPNYRGEAKVATWIYQIAHHHVLHARRARARHPEWTLVPDDAEPGDDDAPLAVSRSPEDEVLERIALQEALACLAPKHREALDLAFVHGFTLDEVGQILGVPVGTVKSRISYARRALRLALALARPGTEGTPANG
jgi:RNA polymerase sigma-70 factor (ECF subfamily)